jgi:hypothetical protein
MSKMTLRKRISLVMVTALTSGVLTSVVSSPVANANNTVVSTDSTAAANAAPTGTSANSMFTATVLSQTGAAVLVTDDTGAGLTSGRSLGLLAKDASSGTAQTATMLVSGTLSLYVPTYTTATTVAFVATSGTFGTSASVTPTLSQDRRTITVLSVGTAATTVGVTWTAPSTAGTYTISMYNGASGTVSVDTPARTLGAAMTVTVVAASAGGSYSAAKSFCKISQNTAASATDNVDGLAGTINGQSMYVNFALKDAYNNALDNGNIVITATTGAVVSYGDGSTPVVGTTSTHVAYGPGTAGTVRVAQATAGVPMQSTVTVTYNGTTVCTKTVAIYGEVAKLAVTVTDVQDLSGSTGKADFLGDGWAPSSPRAGHFYVLATDAAGNQVATDGLGTFDQVAASLAGQTIVTALSVTSSATVNSSTSPGRISTGTYTCGATAGELKTAQLQWTNTSNGKVTTSPAFTLRCADNPYSYTASWDKASYVQGEIATLTVKFLDSKGNPANSTSGTGTWTSVTPMLTAVSATGAAAGLGLTGSKTYTYSVGTASGMTAGTYVSIIDFTTLTGAETAVKATPSYKLSTGGDTTTNADVLKSIVALIASINKQIQALQKLILKR